MNRERLLHRLLDYVRINTTANDSVDDYPSSPGQWELGRRLGRELEEIGLSDVRQDERGLVWATIPANCEHTAPTIAFNAHLDTSPETNGTDVQPQVIRGYGGGDIVLPGAPEQVIRERDNPELADLRGATLITSDGTTLLGGDDKAGLAIIVETAAYLMEHPELQRGSIRLLFTCDEEIGCGVKHVDPQELGAAACYTLDGGGANTIDVETFSADLATVHFHGVNIHPSIAKGKMVNAIRAAGDFVQRLPSDRMSPETTDEREGFLHPYVLQGGVGSATLKVLLRDFDTERLADQAELLKRTASEVQAAFPGMRVEVRVSRQYRNMATGLDKEPRAVELARQAHERLGRTAKLTVIRGGTDGSQLTELGLPTPNLSSGQHNPHSPLEWACLDEMVQAAELLVQLVQLWAEQPTNGTV